MKCNQIQDLILTDYLDGQLDEKKGAIIEKHLTVCACCRELVDATRKGVLAPFSTVKGIEPPGFLWERIKDAIITEQQSNRYYQPWVEKVRKWVFLPRIAVVAPIVTILILIGVMMPLKVTHQQNTQTKVQEQVAYLAFLTEETSTEVLSGSNGFGTLLEEYFL